MQWLRRWLGDDADAAPEPRRWIVVDTETSGLDPDRDRLLAIGAVAIVDGRIALGDSFALDIRDERPLGADNVLLHGLGQQRRAAGVPLAEALGAWRAYSGACPLVGFHAEFDRRVLAAAGAHCGLPPDRRRWLDVAGLAASCAPVGGVQRSLDSWLQVFAIPVLQRHDPASDALATAQLLLRLLAPLESDVARRHAALRRRVDRHLRDQAMLGAGA